MKPKKQKLSKENFVGLSEEDREQQFLTFLTNILVEDTIKTVLNKNISLPGEHFPREGENILVDE